MLARSIAALTAIACSLAFACGAPPPDVARANARSQAITGGTPDDADPAVVGLVDDTSKLVCTGTLIAPHVVLTAAHCAINASSFSRYRAFFGSDLAAGGTFIPISNAHVHPAFDPGTFANDVALLALASRAPVAPALLLEQASDAMLAGASVRVVGFGETSATTQDFGRKRSGTANVSSVSAASFELLAAPSQPCEGDSGGPGFLQIAGVDYVAGVTSHGDTTCSTHDFDVRVDAFVQPFIQPYLALAADGTVAAGDTCFYAEHCANGAACVTADDEPRIRYCAPACTTKADCPSKMSCTQVDGGGSQCRYPLPTPSALGSACNVDGDCIAGDQCIDTHICSHRCNAAVANDCETGFECTNVGDIRFYCTPAPPPPASSSSCKCATAAAHGDSIAWLAGVTSLAMIIARVRRRRRA